MMQCPPMLGMKRQRATLRISQVLALADVALVEALLLVRARLHSQAFQLCDPHL